jgi:hypothetical protein
MTITIETKKLKNFIEAVTIKGKIADLKLNFTEEGVTCDSMMEGNIGATFALLKTESFKEYEVLEDSICITNTTTFMNVLNLFEKEITLEVNESVLKIVNEKKFAHLKLKTEDATDSIFPADRKETLLGKFTDFTDIDVSILKNSVTNSSALGVSNFELSNVDNVLTVITGEEGFDRIEETIGFEYKDFTGKFESIFKEVISIIPDKAQFSIIDSNTPLMFSFETTDFSISIMVAPLME